MKQDAGEEYKRYRALEQYAHDKESEVNKLNSKILRLENDKEILEKQIGTISKFGEMHGSSFNPILAPKVLSNRETELVSSYAKFIVSSFQMSLNASKGVNQYETDHTFCTTNGLMDGHFLRHFTKRQLRNTKKVIFKRFWVNEAYKRFQKHMYIGQHLFDLKTGFAKMNF